MRSTRSGSRVLPGPPKVCRIIAFYRFWAIILPILGGLGTRVSARQCVFSGLRVSTFCLKG